MAKEKVTKTVGTDKSAEGREKAVEVLKQIGFTHATVPFKGEYIKVEL